MVHGVCRKTVDIGLGMDKRKWEFGWNIGRRFQAGSSKLDACVVVLRIIVWVDMYKYHGPLKSKGRHVT